MLCSKCGRDIPDDALLCCYCGKSTAKKSPSRKKRGNGQGCVYKRGDKYVAEKTLGYYVDADGKRKRKTVRKTFDRKKDAVEALPSMSATDRRLKNDKATFTFEQVYDLWLPTHNAGASTINCYKAAWKYFDAIHSLYAHEVDIDDLQECIDECPYGKRTRENMKTLVGLIYKYGVPRGYFPEKLILSDYLRVGGESGAGGVGLPDEYVKAIKAVVGTVPGADLVTAQCYLGFRPSEFLALTKGSYDSNRRVFVGGAKTAAGKNRIVTVAPAIQSIIDTYAGKPGEQFFCSPDGKPMRLDDYRNLFYSVLSSLGLDNPMVEAGNGLQRHKYTPHSCRHVFSTMMKRAQGSDKDKQALIGHSSAEMLRYYQDTPIEDLKKITDQFV